MLQRLVGRPVDDPDGEPIEVLYDSAEVVRPGDLVDVSSEVGTLDVIDVHVEPQLFTT